MTAPSNDVDDSVYFEEYAPSWRPLLVLVFPILPVFWKYRVNVTPTKITFGYSYVRSELDRSDVVTAEPVEHVDGLTQWGGWGIRYNIRWETGYIVKNGPAVRIEVKKDDEGGTKIYVFNCKEAARVCSILNGTEE